MGKPFEEVQVDHFRKICFVHHYIKIINRFLYTCHVEFMFKFFDKRNFLMIKVEKILKGSLDSIPSHSPSLKIQIMGGKVCLRCKGIAGCCQQTFENKKFVDITQQCFVLLPQVSRQ